MIHFSNQTDYEVQREMDARITRRAGQIFTAFDEAGNWVRFELKPFGVFEILEQHLDFATHGFPGFGKIYYRDE